MVLISALAVALMAAPQDAPMTLITDHGVELSANERVFLLFAALNAAGYAEETERKGPPLNAPVFHPLREKVRDAMRSQAAKAALPEIRSVFEANPVSIETYLEATLGLSEKASLSAQATELAKQLGVIDQFRTAAGVEGVMDKLAEEQRAHMKALKGALETDFAKVDQILADEQGFKAPLELVVVPNPLEGHGVTRKIAYGGKTYLVVGPGLDAARVAVLNEAVLPTVNKMVKTAYPRAKALASSWSTLKTSRRIASQWADGSAYLASALTHAIAHRATQGEGRDADEAFIDVQAQHGVRWARIAVRMVDSKGSGSFKDRLPKLVSTARP